MAHFRALRFRKLGEGVRYREVHLENLMLCYYELEPGARHGGIAGEGRIIHVVEGDITGSTGGTAFAIGPGEVVLVEPGAEFQWHSGSRTRLIEARSRVVPEDIIPID